MIRCLGLVICVVLLCWSAPAMAQANGRTCQYDLECPATYSCSDEGWCTQRGSQVEQSADAECGTDRRCRIDRLKRKNRARRHQRIIEEERYVKSLLKSEEKERLDNFPRLKKPIVANYRVSRLGPLGVRGAYTLFGHLQPSVAVGYSDLYAFTSTGTTFSSGFLSAWWIEAGGSYLFLENWFTPYVSAAFFVMNGEYGAYNDFDFGTSFTQAVFHAASVGGGFDIQLKFGLNTRLGLVYRPLVYNQAKTGPGSYVPATRQGLAEWFGEMARVDVIFLLGWAF